MNFDSDADLLPALNALPPDKLAALERQYSGELQSVAPELASQVRRKRRVQSEEKRRDIAHRRAQSLQKRWDRAMTVLRRIQDEARELAERYPEFIDFSDMPEETAPSTAVEQDIAAVMEQAVDVWEEPVAEVLAEPDPEPIPAPLTLAQRMARSFNRNQHLIAEKLAP